MPRRIRLSNFSNTDTIHCPLPPLDLEKGERRKEDSHQIRIEQLCQGETDEFRPACMFHHLVQASRSGSRSSDDKHGLMDCDVLVTGPDEIVDCPQKRENGTEEDAGHNQCTESHAMQDTKRQRGAIIGGPFPRWKPNVPKQDESVSIEDTVKHGGK